MDVTLPQQADHLLPSRDLVSAVLCEFWVFLRFQTCVHSLFLHLLTILRQPSALYSFAGDTILRYSFSYSIIRQATADIDRDRTVLSATLIPDLGRISACGSTNHVCFNPSKNSLPSVLSTHLLTLPN